MPPMAHILAVCLLVAMLSRWRQIWMKPRSHASETHPARLEAEVGLRRRLSVEPSPDIKVVRDRDRWKGAGGEFGLQADWRRAVAAQDGHDEQSLRGEACLTHERQLEVRDILGKRDSTTVARKQVAACVRTKDFGRFLPEWIAFHYVTGVDEISVYDDNSADNTSTVLQPFIESGIVRYIREEVTSYAAEMEPLNHCLNYYLRKREQNPTGAPTWILFHDEDEYLFPADTHLTISQALDYSEDRCCVLVPRIQYGSSGYSETPPGLMLETFLMSKELDGWLQPGYEERENIYPKVMVNLDPARPRMGIIQPPLKSMHNAKGCPCRGVRASPMRINHYLGSKGDFFDRTRLYWTDYSNGEDSPEAKFTDRDGNNDRSDKITHWACATREILYRIVNGLDLKTGVK